MPHRNLWSQSSKLNYKHVYEKSKKHGIINDGREYPPNILRGGQEKSEVKSTTVAKDIKEAVRRHSVPSRGPKKKEEPKKKGNTSTPQWIHRPSGNGNNPEPGREYKRDNTTLVPIRNSPGDYSWNNKNWQGKNGKLSCRYHKPLGISAQDYLSQTPDHCIKSSMLGRRAEPVQAFTENPVEAETRATGNQPPNVAVTKRG